MSTRKISDDPFFNLPMCPSPQHHTPPAQTRIATRTSFASLDGWAVGQYEHTCPDCGNVTRFGVSETPSGQKDYREFSSAISGGASYPHGSTEKEIEESKAAALAFLRKRRKGGN